MLYLIWGYIRSGRYLKCYFNCEANDMTNYEEIYLNYISENDFKLLGDIRSFDNFLGKTYHIYFDRGTIVVNDDDDTDDEKIKAYYKPNLMQQHHNPIYRVHHADDFLDWGRPITIIDTEAKDKSGFGGIILEYSKDMGITISRNIKMSLATLVGRRTDEEGHKECNLKFLSTPPSINGYFLRKIYGESDMSQMDFIDVINYVDIKRPVNVLSDAKLPEGCILSDLFKQNHKQVSELGRVGITKLAKVEVWSDESSTADVVFGFKDGILRSCYVYGSFPTRSPKITANGSYDIYPAEAFKLELNRKSNGFPRAENSYLVDIALNLGLYQKWEIFEMLL